MEIQSKIMSPNIEISDRLLSANARLKGRLVSHRFKKIDGYRISWSDMEGQFNLFGRGILNDSPTDQDFDENKEGPTFDRITQNKIPTFYNQKYGKSSKNLPQTKFNEIATLNQMKGYVAELAITFKNPMTYDEIKRIFPKDLRVNWYWIGLTGTDLGPDFSNRYLRIQADQEELKSVQYKDFRLDLLKGADTVLRTHNDFDMVKYARTYAKKYPKLSDAKFWGGIITGKSENFKQIQNADWIDSSSIGVTIKTVPYLKPEY